VQLDTETFTSSHLCMAVSVYACLCKRCCCCAMPSCASATCANSACVTQCLCCKWLCHTQHLYSANYCISATQALQLKHWSTTLVTMLLTKCLSIQATVCLPFLHLQTVSLPHSALKYCIDMLQEPRVLPTMPGRAVPLPLQQLRLTASALVF